MDNLQNCWVGTWDYRSFNNYTLAQEGNVSKLLFGQGTIIIEASDIPNQLIGTIGDPKRESWELELTGSINYGDPFTARFQGAGVVDGNQWIYEYVAYLVNPWQNGVNQVPAMVGSVIRQIPHPGASENGQTAVHPAGVVASFYCVKE